jgi:hypothetical protein
VQVLPCVLLDYIQLGNTFHLTPLAHYIIASLPLHVKTPVAHYIIASLPLHVNTPVVRHHGGLPYALLTPEITWSLDYAKSGHSYVKMGQKPKQYIQELRQCINNAVCQCDFVYPSSYA